MNNLVLVYSISKIILTGLWHHTIIGTYICQQYLWRETSPFYKGIVPCLPRMRYSGIIPQIVILNVVNVSQGGGVLPSLRFFFRLRRTQNDSLRLLSIQYYRLALNSPIGYLTIILR